MRIQCKARNMSFKRKYSLYTVVLLVLLFAVNSTIALLFSGDGRKMNETVEKYFTHENNNLLRGACRVWPRKSFALDYSICHWSSSPKTMCFKHRGIKLADKDGYVFITSNAVSLEELFQRNCLGDQIVSLLKCFNQTTLKLKIKYILVLDFIKGNNSNTCEEYSNFFKKL